MDADETQILALAATRPSRKTPKKDGGWEQPKLGESTADERQKIIIWTKRC